MNLRISQIGLCKRKLIFAAYGIEEEITPRLKRIFEIGTLFEEGIVKHAEEIFGAKIEDRQKEVEIFGVKGHIDGIIKTDDFGISVFEAKTMNKFSFANFQSLPFRIAFPHYYTQVQLYMAALGLQNALVFARNTEIPYKSEDYWEHQYIFIPYDKEFVERMEKEISELQTIKIDANSSAEELNEALSKYPPEKTWECNLCTYSPYCFGEYIEEEKIVTNTELEVLIKEYIDAEQKYKSIKEKRDNLKDMLINILDCGNVYKSCGYEIKKVRSSTKYLDKKSVPQDILLTLEQYYIDTPYERIILKKLK